ncbi:MAG: alpha/beta hydrolase [Rhizobiaceae bacterium]|nr:MAG: alpha/beta hydrolase [Rhizobiaceae bacterium]
MSKEQLDFMLQLSAQFPPPQGGPDDMRAWFEAINEQTPIADGSMIERVTSGPAGGDLIRLPGCDEGRLIIYFHGGGFLFGSSRSHRAVASNLARASGCAVLAADYRLAPEHPAPTANDDAFAVYRWALDKGYPASRVALCGDSAGGNLAIGAAIRARDTGLPVPAALMLMSPALDLADDLESHRAPSDAPLVTAALMELFNSTYIQGGDRRAPAINPFYADLSGLPPTLVHVGSWELLLDDSREVVARISDAGGRAELKVWEGMCHSWQLWAPMLDEGMASIEEAGAFLRHHLT